MSASRAVRTVPCFYISSVRCIPILRLYDADGIWKPNKDGLGMGHVFEELNKIYGEGFIKY